MKDYQLGSSLTDILLVNGLSLSGDGTLIKNGQPDASPVDNCVYQGAIPIGMLSKAYKDAIDLNVEIPYEHQFTLSFDHELFADFKVGVSYIYKIQKNLMSDIPWDKATSGYRKTYEKVPDWWVAFKTTIPAYQNFPAMNVTIYFMSNNALEWFTMVTNISGAEAIYLSLDFTFFKRMSYERQLGESLVQTKAERNYEIAGGSIGGMFQTPNYYINRYGRLTYNRLLIIRLFGTLSFPYRIIASFFFIHTDGSPWRRTVIVVPPAAWAAANNAKTWPYSIQVETLGTRRDQPTESLDFRLEKNLKLGPGRLGVYMDVFNLLGSYTISMVKNPGGTWRQVDANTTEGIYSPGWTGLTGVAFSRIFKFSLLYKF